jgi:hypothetical protein
MRRLLLAVLWVLGAVPIATDLSDPTPETGVGAGAAWRPEMAST